ncbi:MAG: RluA family pseudouridine synthase [Gammaproteobacteria bacterium]
MRTVTVAREHAGRRVDNFLQGELGGVPRGLVYKLLRSGQVRVNGARAKPDRRLVSGDEVRIPPVDDGSGPVQVPAVRIAAFEPMILHEDARFLVVDKPAGLACHAGSGIRYGLIEIARAARADLERLDLAHRLDRDTSGCVVMCKDVATLRAVNAALRERSAVKRYTALLCGHLAPHTAHIEATLTIARDVHGERRASVHEAGKQARTLVERITPVGGHTLVELRLETGRMHQIRAHARHLGHPVAGDRHYGDEQCNAALAAHGLERLFLHASQVTLTTPFGNLDVHAPLPHALAVVLTQLGAP